MSIHTYNEMKKLRDVLRPIQFEIAARDKHVGYIKIEVRTLKERCCHTTESVPYKRMPRIMIEANLEEKVNWHNIFTPKYYISQAIGP